MQPMDPPVHRTMALFGTRLRSLLILGYHSGSTFLMSTSAAKTITAGLILAVVLLGESFAAQSSGGVPSNAEIREILVERIDNLRQSVGIVVGIIEPPGRRVVAYGKLDSGDPRPLDGDTVFEIGSITKVFTSLLLADMVERREVQLTDPVANYLPPQVRVPGLHGGQITLKDLSMHLSALPRMPSNVDSSDPANPFAEYSVTRLYEFLSSYQLPRDIGSRFEYSNLGGALLGHALARRSGLDYGALVETRIARTLGMDSTRIPLTREMKEHLAAGHAYGLTPTANWDLGALDAAGALHSTANDLLKFLAASLGYTDTPLAPAMASMTRAPQNIDQGEVGLGWFIQRYEGAEIISHGGSTGGYRSFIGYDPQTRVGVVVLSNTGTGAGVEDIGIHLLNSKVPLLAREDLEPDKERREFPLDAESLARFTGRYRFPSSQMASIMRDGDHLLLHAEGEVKIAFYPESARDFFAKIMDAQISFETNEQGKVMALRFYRGGSMQRVRRVE
jgi:serine-type D-Ala-D-Ala carboxypeptidase/endopeptidase